MGTPDAKHLSPVGADPWSACRNLPSHLRLWIVAGVVLWLDLWSKHAVFAALGPREIRPLVEDVINLQRSLNDGAVFGSFTGMVSMFMAASLVAMAFVLYLFASSSRTQRVFHMSLGLIIAGAIGNLYDRTYVQADVVKYTIGDSPQRVIIGRVLDDDDPQWLRIGSWPDGQDVKPIAKDRITSVATQGVVRDFIKFVPEFPEWVPRLGGRDIWPWIFNIADASLVCGVGTLLVYPWFTRKPRRSET